MQNYQRFAIGVFVIIAAALISFGVYNRFAKRVAQEEAPETIPLPTPQSGFPTGEASPPPLQPESGSNTAQILLGITVSSPQAGQIINSPIKVAGLANVPEGEVKIEVKDAGGKVLGSTLATACFALDLCPYEGSVVFDQPQTSAGSIDVYSGEDPNRQNLQTVNIKF